MTDTAGRWTVHASDRTLAASLGFADPDKREPRHELACQYLATDEGLARLGKAVVDPIVEGLPLPSLEDFRGERRLEPAGFQMPPSPEVAVVKGDHRYQHVVGFLDLVLLARYKHVWDGEKVRRSWNQVTCQGEQRWEAHRGEDGRVFSIVVEVKATPTPASDVVRQLNLYRQFYVPLCRPCLWLVVTTYPVTEADLRTFEAASIGHARLGRSFDAWCELQRRERSSGGAASIEL
jgi:hypothetical protein